MGNNEFMIAEPLDFDATDACLAFLKDFCERDLCEIFKCAIEVAHNHYRVNSVKFWEGLFILERHNSDGTTYIDKSNASVNTIDFSATACPADPYHNAALDIQAVTKYLIFGERRVLPAGETQNDCSLFFDYFNIVAANRQREQYKDVLKVVREWRNKIIGHNSTDQIKEFTFDKLCEIRDSFDAALKPLYSRSWALQEKCRELEHKLKTSFYAQLGEQPYKVSDLLKSIKKVSPSRRGDFEQLLKDAGIRVEENLVYLNFDPVLLSGIIKNLWYKKLERESKAIYLKALLPGNEMLTVKALRKPLSQAALKSLSSAELNERASSGDSAAQNELGERLLEEKKYTQAVKCFEAAADDDNAEALFNLGLCYEKGTGKEKSNANARRYLRKAAEADSVRALIKLAFCYENGSIGFEKNETEAFHKLSRAAKLDSENGEALYNLGRYYQFGIGVEKDLDEAYFYYCEAREVDFARAENGIALLYKNGYDGKNSTHAFDLYFDAAKNGEPVAQCNLALAYKRGVGTDINMAEAVKWFKLSAQQGNVRSQFNLAYSYDVGEGIEQSHEDAVYWYTKAAENGYSSAQYNLALCLQNGTGVEKDLQKAITWYERAAGQGHASAQFNLGVCYESGDEGLEKSYKLAAVWYEKAANQGHKKAQYNLGRFYDFGLGVKRDYDTAMNWYKKAAEQGHAGALANIGTLYYTGNGVNVDYKKAVEYYLKAAQLNVDFAQFNLGICYEYGKGVEKDLNAAMDWYKKAADQGHEKAKKAIERLNTANSANTKSPQSGDTFLEDTPTQPKPANAASNEAVTFFNAGCDAEKANDLKKAAELYTKAANLGHVSAQFNLALCYEFSKGVNQNHKVAALWYEKAAQQGHAKAQYNLAISYKKGEGVEKSLEKAVYWCKKAAENGHEKAKTLLEKYSKELNEARQSTQGGDAFLSDTPSAPTPVSSAQDAASLYNLGVDADKQKNYEKAVEYYTKAADLGHKSAQFNLGLCHYFGDGTPKNYTAAAKRFEQAAKQGHEKAIYYLGVLYFDGNGVNKNVNKAIELYKESAEKGFHRAQYVLALCYENGDGVEKNLQKAVFWYEHAAKQKNKSAQYNLALCYHYGDGTPKNIEKAMYWYEEAIKQNHEKAMYYLGNIYYGGDGVAQDATKAFGLYKSSADKGYVRAIRMLGECYHYGRGVDKNETLAVKYYEQAANLGDSVARDMLEKIRLG